ncbi:HlyD family type I secretion periplasmic adaptor subunit [uncultured Ferrimonas sp.]|uniref:HlyD family type I secretion periplasmic adaptor subunit n=1 Tax=uncultured Ferrimonas sp. TaxID=432640 RepID=UPI002626DDA9|nr:HlyD family type I secretion periplasmic adaptor subunit [uncultured Ferrimonas sp.]
MNPAQASKYDWDDELLFHPPVYKRKLVWVLTALILSLLVWASLSTLDEVTRGQGKVVPSSQVQVIQSLDGGIIEELMVREGMLVSQGTPLLRIDATRFASDLAQREQETLNLQFGVFRLQAQLASVQLGQATQPQGDSINWQQQLQLKPQQLSLPAPLASAYPELAKQHRADYQHRLDQLQNQLSIQAQAIHKKENELKELATRLKTLGISLQLVKRELEITKPLEERGIVSEVELIKLQRQANDASGELASLRQVRPSLLLERDEAVLKRREIALAFLSESQAEFNEMSAQLARLNEANVGAQDKVDRTLILSPVAGTIKSLNINTLGGVVQPGEDLIEIVPSEDKLLVEAQIAPKDIAFLRPGLPATVKVTAYDFTRYGGLNGVVEHISADTITDEEGNSFYVVRVRTDSNRLGKAEAPLPIIPGMITSVDVLTGEKSVLAYLLTPILRAKANALRER